AAGGAKGARSAVRSARSVMPGRGGRGPGAAMNALATGNAQGGGAKGFAAGGGGGTPMITAAASPGIAGGGLGSSIGAGVGPQQPGTAQGPGQGTPNTGGPIGGNDDGGGGGNVDPYLGAVQAYEQHPSLIQGRGYVYCLIKAFEDRYRKAGETLTALHGSMQAGPLGHSSDPAVIADVGEAATRIRGMQADLLEGKTCFRKNQSADEEDLCFRKVRGPFAGMQGEVDWLTSLHGRIGVAGQSVEHDGCQMFYCPVPPMIQSYQNQINSAKSQLSEMHKWGHEEEAGTLATDYFDGTADTLQQEANRIDRAEILRRYGDEKGEVIAPRWEASRNAMSTGLAETGPEWDRYTAQATVMKKINQFVLANIAMKNAANLAANGAVVLEMREGPPPPKRPASQFVRVEDIDVKECDVPPPPPPPGGKK
ncbi:MAG: hypothetical protein HY553_05615, partial [Elusimicrobia bacterium]|nr:hypothetical protein [Elusimicrobiota bacterium]